MFRLIGGVGIVGRAEVEDELVHVARLHIDIVGEGDGERTPLVGCGIVEGDSHFLLETACVADAPSVVEVVVLVEREDVAVINFDNAEHHGVEADGIEVDGGFAHFGNDDAFLGPADFGAEVSQVEGKLYLFQKGVACQILDARSDGEVDVFELVAIDV